MNSPDAVRGGERSIQDKMMDTIRQPVPLRDSVCESMLGGHTFERLQLGDFVLMLLLDTAEFRSRAMSYRDFNVAAGAWCLDFPRYGRALGYNVKIDETDLVNIHAEDLITEKAKDADFKEISALAVIGPPQEDHESGLETETLHPCGRCRTKLNELGLIKEHTLFVTARPDFTVIEFAELSGIIALHDRADPSGITTFRYDETPAILQPRDWPKAGQSEPVQIEEIDSSDYDSTIGRFLIDRFINMQNQ